jgi:hypothetical protein
VNFFYTSHVLAATVNRLQNRRSAVQEFNIRIFYKAGENK